MSRLRVVLLLLLAMLLVMDGTAGSRWSLAQDSRDAASGTREPAARVVDRALLDAADIAVIVEGANPELSPQERDRIGSAVVRFGERYGLDAELVLAVILVESGGRPWVRSPKGAVGLMQVMPQQSARLGVPGNAATIESNIEAGCAILAENIARLGEQRGILSYFWGSDIRGDAYLQRVEAARERVRRELDS